MATSRYGASQHTVFTGTESCAVPTSQIPDAVAAMRQVFATERTFGLAWRLRQLEGLLRLLRDGREELCAAMKHDLHKSAFECYATEISLVESECVEAIAGLKGWMEPQATSTSGLNWPAGSYTVRDPLGVVLIMGAWNYPVQLTLAPLVGALAGGNCVLVRPGSYSVETSHAMCRLLTRYLDPDCIKVAEGDRFLTTKILEQKWDMIFYTGSEFVGRLVAEAAAKHLCPVVLELGGKSPTIIDKTAHLEHAAERVVWATFLNSGQTCVRPDFCLVHEEVADAFFALVKGAIGRFYSSDPQTCEFYGRCINAKAWERLAGLVEKGRAKIIHGGKVEQKSKFIEPTVFDFGADLAAFRAHPLMQDELFGPLLPCARYKKLEDVVQFCRTLPTGKPLALYCYSRDSAVLKAIEQRTTSGGLCLNDSVMHLANHELPFGGVGESGMGSYHGHRSFAAFTHEKAVLRKYPGIDELPGMKLLLAARFPPYTPFKQLAIAVFGQRLVAKAVNASPRKLFWLLVAWVLLRLFGYKLAIVPR